MVATIAFVVVVAAMMLFALDNRGDVNELLQDELRVAIDASWPPFAYYVGEELTGIEIELAREVAKRLGVNVTFSNMSFDSLYDALLINRVDAVIATLVLSQHRTDDFRYTRPYFDNGLVLVSGTGLTPEHLQNIVLSFEYGSDAHGLANRWKIYTPGLIHRPYESPRYALVALIAGEADAALVDNLTYQLFINERANTNLEAVSVTHVPFAIAVSREHDALADHINKTLSELMDTGILEEIIRNGFRQIPPNEWGKFTAR